mmetsp:Transcript_61718/g.109936  ORF Transcript_61718/g.109936 Transcript_61718/m.109936 type:complete len:93 (-) Transcript_61718:452-730(-)
MWRGGQSLPPPPCTNETSCRKEVEREVEVVEVERNTGHHLMCRHTVDRQARKHTVQTLTHASTHANTRTHTHHSTSPLVATDTLLCCVSRQY